MVDGHAASDELSKQFACPNEVERDRALAFKGVVVYGEAWNRARLVCALLYARRSAAVLGAFMDPTKGGQKRLQQPSLLTHLSPFSDDGLGQHTPHYTALGWIRSGPRLGRVCRPGAFGRAVPVLSAGAQGTDLAHTHLVGLLWLV